MFAQAAYFTFAWFPLIFSNVAQLVEPWCAGSSPVGSYFNMKDNLINTIFLIYIGWTLSVLINLFIFDGFWMNPNGYRRYLYYLLIEADKTKHHDFVRHLYEDGVIKK